MTEKDWLAGSDPDALIAWIGSCSSERKTVLTCCAQCRRLGALLTPRLAAVVDARERLANSAGPVDFGPAREVIDDERARAERRRDQASRDGQAAAQAARDECGRTGSRIRRPPSSAAPRS